VPITISDEPTSVWRTLTLIGRGERMRAGGPIDVMLDGIRRPREALESGSAYFARPSLRCGHIFGFTRKRVWFPMRSVVANWKVIGFGVDGAERLDVFVIRGQVEAFKANDQAGSKHRRHLPRQYLLCHRTSSAALLGYVFVVRHAPAAAHSPVRLTLVLSGRDEHSEPRAAGARCWAEDLVHHLISARPE
jgi:hypothetical protein